MEHTKNSDVQGFHDQESGSQTVPEASDDLETNLHTVNDLLMAECTSLGVPLPSPVAMNQIYILSPKEFKEKWPDKSDNTAGLADGNDIYLKDKHDRLGYLRDYFIDTIEQIQENAREDESHQLQESDDTLWMEAWDEAEELHGEYPDADDDKEGFEEYSDQYVVPIFEEKVRVRDERYENDLEEIRTNFDAVHREVSRQVLLHEALHVASHTQDTYANITEETWLSSRVGYAIEKPDNQLLFWSLNEAVTEKISQELLGEMGNAHTALQSAVDTFAMHSYDPDFVNTTMKEYLPPSYDEDITVLDLLMEKISQKTGQSIHDIWTTIKRGYFAGNMMHLRLIEQALEPGALRLYANCSPDNYPPHDDSVSVFRKYLESVIPDVQSSLFQALVKRLPQSEQEKINRRRGH